MRWILIVTLLFGVITTSCKKERYRGKHDLSGTYTGTFTRKGDGAGATANVTLHFVKDTCTGSSDIPRYPAICKSTFKVTGNKVAFGNTCFWTADFDGTLILDGEYRLTFLSASSFRLERSTAHITDVYELHK